MSIRLKRERFPWEWLIMVLLVAVGVSSGWLLYVDFKESSATNAQMKVQGDFITLEMALQYYHYVTENWPTEEEGLRILSELTRSGPYMDSVPLDPWGQEYRYEMISGYPRISTLGKDGIPGGKFENRDLSYTVRSTRSFD